MKELRFLLAGVLALFILSGCTVLKGSVVQDKAPISPEIAPAQIPVATIPERGEIAIPDSGFSGKFEIVEVRDGEVIFHMPYYIARGNPKDFTVSSGVHWTDGKEWTPVIPPDDDYTLKVNRLEDGENLKVSVSLPLKGNKWYWVRPWGFNNLMQEPMWIDLSDPHMRHSAPTEDNLKGSPAYEFIVNTETKEVRKVAKDYGRQK